MTQGHRAGTTAHHPDRRAPLAAFHVPQIAQRTDGRWGVFCAACSWLRGDYVYPCDDGRGWIDEMPPSILEPR